MPVRSLKILGQPPIDKELSVRVHLSQISGAQPAVHNLLRRQFGLVGIATHQGRRLYPDFAPFSVAQFLSVRVKNAHGGTREDISYADDTFGVVFFIAFGLVIYRTHGEGFTQAIAGSDGHRASAGAHQLVHVLERLGRTALSAHDGEAEKAQIRTLAFLDAPVHLLEKPHPERTGNERNLRAEAEYVPDKLPGRQARIQIDRHSAIQRCQHQGKEAGADKGRQGAVGRRSFAERRSVQVEGQGILEHGNHGLVAHPNLVGRPFLGAAGRAEQVRIPALDGGSLQGAGVVSEAPDGGIGRHVLVAVAYPEPFEAVERGGQRLHRESHGMGGRYHHDVLEVFPGQELPYGGLQSVKDEGDAAFPHHALQGLGIGHQVGQVGNGTHHVGRQHDIEKFRQGGAEEEDFFALLHAHPLDDTPPQMHLLHQGGPAYPASEVNQGVMTVPVLQNAALKEFPERFLGKILRQDIFVSFDVKLFPGHVLGREAFIHKRVHYLRLTGR